MAKISDEAHRDEMEARRRRQLALPRGWITRGPGGKTANGRNHCLAAIGRFKAKWLIAPTVAQVHPERHTQPRSKRRA